MKRRSFLLGLGAVVVSATACDSKGKLIEISGNVTVDKAPLAAGEIRFVPEDSTLGSEEGKIEGGSYKMKSKAGKMKVEIWATREVPGKKGPMGEPLLEDAVAPDYNINTKLTADVSSSNTTFNFDVTSK